MLRHAARVLLGFVLMSPLLVAWGAEPVASPFRTLGTGEGLSHPTVTSIVQDPDGFVWLGTLDGLNRFDGRSVRVLRSEAGNEASLPHSHIETLFVDASGALWVGTDRGLGRIDRETLRVERPHPDVVGGVVNRFAEAADGRLYVATLDGLAVLSKDRRTAKKLTGPVGGFGALRFDRTGKLYGGSSRGLERIDPETGQTTAVPLPVEVAPLVLGLVEDRLGALWASTSTIGLLRRDPRDGSWRAFRHDPSHAASLPSDSVSEAVEAAGGGLWIGSAGGLARLDVLTLELTRVARQGRSIPMVDRDGGVWVGLDLGAGRHDPAAPRFHVLRHDPRDPESLGADPVFAAFEDGASRVWIGTEAGLDLVDLDTDRATHYRNDPGDPLSLGHGTVRGLAESPPGTLWVATDGGGLSRLDTTTGKSRQYRHDPRDPTTLGDDRLRKLIVDRSGVLWIGSAWSGLNRLDPATGKVRRFRHDPTDASSLPNDIVRAVLEAPDGSILVGTARGLARLDPSTGRFKREPTGPLSTASVSSLRYDRAGRLLVGTIDDGLLRVDGASAIAHFGRADGLPNETVYAALEDGRGRLWLPTNNRLGVLSATSRTTWIFDEKDGTAGDEFNGGAAILTSTGRLVLGGMRGVTVVRPDDVPDPTFRAPVVLTGARTPDRVLREAGPAPLVLTHRDTALSFSFAALDFARGGDVRYETRLEGRDSTFSPPGASAEVAFRELPPGAYVLHVRASRNGQRSKAELALPFTLPPPPWRTPWAYAAYALALGALVAAGVGARTSAIQRRALELETTVRERTAQLETLVADLRRSERAAHEAREEAQKASRAKAEFLANMSHEIRTPLNAVIGLTGVLLDEDLSRKQRDFVETIQSSGDLLLSLLSDILDFSKIESGKLELESIPFRLLDCVRSALDLVAQAAEAKGLTLRMTPGAGLPKVVEGDPTRLRQILANLLVNAIKFTETGGVTVGVSSRPREADGLELTFTVADTGIGIAADRRDRLFRSFSQVDASTTRRFGGSGLGLAISQRLARLMGGDIDVESEPGKGSTFRVVVAARALPDDSPLPAGAEGERLRPVTPEPSAASRRILLVEDNEINQKVTREMLSRLGLTADVAGNGLEALRALDQTPYDVILMDVQMPEMDGLTAARRIRQRSPSPRPTIIAMTAGAFEGDRERCLAAGMDSFLSKPVRLDDLRRVLFPEGATFESRSDSVSGVLAAARREPVSTAMLDKLRQLWGDDEDALAELVQSYLTQSSRRLFEMRSAVAANDAPRLAFLAHSFKGSSAQLGALGLAALCQEIETMVASGKPEGVEDLLRVEDLLDRATSELAEVRQALEAETAPKRSSPRPEVERQ